MLRDAVLLIDGFGALISAVMLGLVLPAFPGFTGMPASVLYWLAFVPACLFFVDVVGHFFVPLVSMRVLTCVVCCNAAYCAASGALLYVHQAQLTAWGWSYFVTELCVLIGLIAFETSVLRLGANERDANVHTGS